MNIGIFAFGRAGCKIADEFKRFEKRTMTHVSEFIFAADTASAIVNDLSHIDDDWAFTYGKQKFEGRGSRADLEPAIRVTKHLSQNIRGAVQTTSRRELDAFLVIGSLGGGTGAAGVSVCSQVLSETYQDIPIYGVGILPEQNEPEMYRMNAARSIQSFSANADNVILFDNDHLGVSVPEANPNISDDADPDTVFQDVNHDIARCLHLLFTADEVRPSGHLQGTTIKPDQLVDVLSAGGLSTMCYVTETLPRPARPGLTGRISELIEYFRVKHQRKKYEQRQAADRRASKTGEHSSEGETPFTNARNLSLATGPDADVNHHEDGLLVRRDEEIETADLPAIPTDDEEIHSNPSQNETDSTTSTESEDSESPPSFDRDWPHPAKLVPLTLDPASSMMNVNPAQTSRNLFLLVGGKQHLSQHAAIRTADWAEEHTAAGFSVAKNYPVKDKKVAALTLCSGIGIPDRIRELQQDGTKIAQDAMEAKRKNPDPKEFNIFENEQTIPPAL